VKPIDLQLAQEHVMSSFSNADASVPAVRRLRPTLYFTADLGRSELVRTASLYFLDKNSRKERFDSTISCPSYDLLLCLRGNGAALDEKAF
jgi:hypothetical protein